MLTGSPGDAPPSFGVPAADPVLEATGDFSVGDSGDLEGKQTGRQDPF
ncbi:MAG: hypothetical protein WKF83_17505 [Nocardioidaceae bacterium]